MENTDFFSSYFNAGIKTLVAQAVNQAIESKFIEFEERIKAQTPAPSAPALPEYLNTEQACELCGGITAQTLLKHVKEGRFPAPHKVGRFNLYDRKELTKAISKLSKGGIEIN